MPNRIIKESIRISKNVNSMSDFQFRLWIYLITYVDDYGRGSADAEILKGFLFPRRKRVTETDIAKGLNDLAGMGCILLYEIDGESYFCFPNSVSYTNLTLPTIRLASMRIPIPIQNPNPNPNPKRAGRALMSSGLHTPRKSGKKQQGRRLAKSMSLLTC